jgi:hypothetical protein
MQRGSRIVSPKEKLGADFAAWCNKNAHMPTQQQMDVAVEVLPALVKMRGHGSGKTWLLRTLEEFVKSLDK